MFIINGGFLYVVDNMRMWKRMVVIRVSQHLVQGFYFQGMQGLLPISMKLTKRKSKKSRIFHWVSGALRLYLSWNAQESAFNTLVGPKESIWYVFMDSGAEMYILFIDLVVI